MNGVLNIDKPGGMTSHDVVARVRRLAGVRRVGHAGTLDPMATGVLLVCVGKTTRLMEYLTPGRKRYRATVRFGVATDSYDAEGRILARSDVDITEQQLSLALEEFRGSILQVPPAFSALKKDGQPLYKLARRGVEVERAARRIEVFELRVLSWRSPDLVLDIVCSAGTYVRSIAHDLGEKLGPGAHLGALRRTASGSFTVERALPLEDIEAAAAQGRFEELLLPPSAAVAHLPRLQLDARERQDLLYGRPLRRSEEAEPEASYAALDESGTLIAIVRFDARARRFRPHKVLFEESTTAR